MNNNHNISDEELEEIERYVLNDMSQEEYVAFTSRVANDSALEAKVKEVRLLLLSLQEATLEGSLNDFHAELRSAEIKKPAAKTTSMRTWLIAAAVIFFISVGSWFFISGFNQNERLFSKYYKPDPGLITAMSTSDNYTFDRAMIDYKTGNYDSAIKAWEGLLSAKPNNDTLNYFIASAYLGLDKNGKAIEHFNKVVAVTDSYFLKDAYWYLGFSLLKEGRKKEAISFIEKSAHENKERLLQSLKE